VTQPPPASGWALREHHSGPIIRIPSDLDLRGQIDLGNYRRHPDDPPPAPERHTVQDHRPSGQHRWRFRGWLGLLAADELGLRLEAEGHPRRVIAPTTAGLI
jgi:hypothetical protein